MRKQAGHGPPVGPVKPSQFRGREVAGVETPVGSRDAPSQQQKQMVRVRVKSNYLRLNEISCAYPTLRFYLPSSLKPPLYPSPPLARLTVPTPEVRARERAARMEMAKVGPNYPNTDSPLLQPVIPYDPSTLKLPTLALMHLMHLLIRKSSWMRSACQDYWTRP